MKWMNKGHEYDEIATKWNDIDRFFVYGISNAAKDTYYLLCFLGLDKVSEIYFVDSNWKHQKSGFCERQVISLPEMLERTLGKTDYAIIDCTWGNSASQALLAVGRKFIYQQNLFSKYYFERKFLPVYMWYKFSKSYCYTAAVHFSTKCNLNCKNCGVFTDRYTDKKDRAIEDVIADIDLIFEKFDFVYHFGTSGGEPFLYPYLAKLLEHSIRYVDKMYIFGNTTNATIPMSEELRNAYIEFNAKSKYTAEGGGAILTIDDYSEYVKNSRPYELLRICQENSINAIVQKYDNWVDFGVGEVDNSRCSEEVMSAYHAACNNICWWVNDGKFYTCSMVLSAVNAGFIQNEENNYVDLQKCTIPEFIEFQNGYTQNGYFDLCRQCGGYTTINRNKINAGEQRERY